MTPEGYVRLAEAHRGLSSVEWAEFGSPIALELDGQAAALLIARLGAPLRFPRTNWEPERYGYLWSVAGHDDRGIVCWLAGNPGGFTGAVCRGWACVEGVNVFEIGQKEHAASLRAWFREVTSGSAP